MTDHETGAGGGPSHRMAVGTVGPGDSAIRLRDHYTVAPLTWLAGSSDRGHRHETNQDAMALGGREADGERIAIVCISDGVSTSLGSEKSAAAAAEVACSTLVAMLRSMPSAGADQVAATMDDAFAAAHDAVLSTAGPDGQAGSCTLIVATIFRGELTVGNIGDCRAYWIGDDGSALLLSVDDSVAQARIELGMSREEAEQGYQAHAITRWLGPDATDVIPRQSSRPIPGAGWLLVCSDGLWNYCSSPQDMATLLRRVTGGDDSTPERACEALVEWAKEQGGRDNITTALVRLDPTERLMAAPSPTG
ncbi:PP2C family protein-serine/threonine phosphatase [Luteococcus sp. Sow4_B9]|uniref:PP2C family protein-serine/threonine phosphatase n=1 Tax=Luteococcus sp. Sow4_B9 TaxID=3438792 RepID=UPI003F989A08